MSIPNPNAGRNGKGDSVRRRRHGGSGRKFLSLPPDELRTIRNRQFDNAGASSRDDRAIKAREIYIERHPSMTLDVIGECLRTGQNPAMEAEIRQIMQGL